MMFATTFHISCSEYVACSHFDLNTSFSDSKSGIFLFYFSKKLGQSGNGKQIGNSSFMY